MDRLDEIVQFLQLSLTPVAMISGVGLLLLTVTNRFGRVVDRTRTIIDEVRVRPGDRSAEKRAEFEILYRRSRMLRASIVFITLSIIASTLLIPVLVSMLLGPYDLRVEGYTLFVGSTLAILGSALFFFADVVLALRALDIEAGFMQRLDVGEDPPRERPGDESQPQ
jgi:polyferredoxin